MYRKACANLVQQLEPLQLRGDRELWLEKIIDYIRASSSDGNIVTEELLAKGLKVGCNYLICTCIILYYVFQSVLL